MAGRRFAESLPACASASLRGRRRRGRRRFRRGRYWARPARCGPPGAAPTICTPAGSALISSPSVLPKRSGLRTAISSSSEAAAGGRFDLRLQHHEGDVEEQDRPGHAERIRDRVADRGIVVAERRDRRLQRRRARARAGEQAERVAELEVHQLHEQRGSRRRPAARR